MDQAKAREVIVQKYIGKKARMVTKNKRVFEGKIMCIDCKANVILHETIAEIDSHHNCPLNYELYNYTDSKMHFQPPSHLSEEEKMKSIREYMGSHYYFGAVMVSGTDIASMQLLPEDKEDCDEVEDK